MQVTISFLPVKLSLVRIPRARLHKFYHPLLRQILSPKHTFLNVTCNELELSILAESQTLEDFESVAERDRQRRSRSPSRDTDSLWSPSPPIIEDWDCVQVCHESWSVLQIDSHSDGIDKSGARVHELSAPLAEAGISILYISSYLCDFILVKSTRVREVVSLMVDAGFDLYPSADSRWASPPPLSAPASPDDDTVSVFDFDLHSSTGAVITRSHTSSRHNSPKVTEFESPTSPGVHSSSLTASTSSEDTEVTVLDPDLTCVGLSEDSADVWALKIVKLVAFPDLILNRSRPSSRKNSVGKDAAPTVRSVGIPTPDSSEDEAEDTSASTKSNGFSSSSVAPITPITPTRKLVSASSPRNCVSFFSFTRTEEGSSLMTDISIVSSLFPPNERHMLICAGNLLEGDEDPDRDEPSPQPTGPLKCLQIDLRKFGLEKHGLVNRYSRVLEENGINHMYSSTFKTANLLVEKVHARRAQELLRTC